MARMNRLMLVLVLLISSTLLWTALGATAPSMDSLRLHTVQNGETLWLVSQKNGTTIARIQELNQLTNPDLIVPGMNLLVPHTNVYVVQAGDTLWRISLKLDVPMAHLIEANQIINPNWVYTGQRLYYHPTRQEISVNGYLVPSPGGVQRDVRLVQQAADDLTYVSVFSMPVQPDGSLQGLRDGQLVAAAKSSGVEPVLTVTNFNGHTFDPDLGHAVISSPAARGQLIESVLAHLEAQGYSGLDIDFENLRPQDRDLYTNFIKEVSKQVRAQGHHFSIAVAPKASDRPNESWVGFFDYAALAEHVDYVILMTYEWGWIGGPPMAIAPINHVEAVLKYATSLIPGEKILMGVPLYGYDWELPDTRENMARGISAGHALTLAASSGVPIRWDTRAASPYFHCWDHSGREHEVWFEDARSVIAKYQLAREYGVKGVSYWVLGNQFPQNWPVLQDLFDVVKH